MDLPSQVQWAEMSEQERAAQVLQLTSKATPRVPQPSKRNIVVPRRGPIRVGFIFPTLALGGAERWLLSLLNHESDYFSCYALGLTSPEPSNRLYLELALKRTLVATTEATGNPHCKTLPSAADVVQFLANRCDVLIAWGQDRLGEIIGDFVGPVILVSHGACHWSKKMLAPSVPAATHLAAVSEAAARSFSGAPCEVIHNGADRERVKSKRRRSAVRREWGIKPDEIAIGHIGRFSWEKNPLAASVAASTLGPGYRAVYVGDGWKAAEVKAAVNTLIPDAVFAPPVEQVGDWLGAIDCYLLASPSEGMSLGLIEAWLAGVPVVATRVGAVPELEAKHGQLVVEVPKTPSATDLAAAVKKAISPANRKMIARAKQVARKHLTAGAMGVNWEKYLRKVCGH